MPQHSLSTRDSKGFCEWTYPQYNERANEKPGFDPEGRVWNGAVSHGHGSEIAGGKERSCLQ